MFCHAHVFQLGPNQHPKRFDSQKSPARVPPLCRLSCPVFWLSTDCKVPFCAAFRRVCAASLRKASRSCRDAQENCPQTTSFFSVFPCFFGGCGSWCFILRIKTKGCGNVLQLLVNLVISLMTVSFIQPCIA